MGVIDHILVVEGSGIPSHHDLPGRQFIVKYVDENHVHHVLHVPIQVWPTQERTPMEANFL